MFVVKRDHERFYKEELADVDASRIIAQPANRGTVVAIMAALLRLLQHNRDAIVGFFPSDHYFADDAAFTATLQSAVEISEKHRDSIVLIGAKPQWPEVEYGWIELGTQLTNGRRVPFFTVNQFWRSLSVRRRTS
jgi:mannose-1-phosphate guanylyltransferase